ncbi:hypothetical protein DXT99_13465 [Pontibacter diazotrophicus]|uniref:RGS domain-containing protein n=1 Tax=Pontibacter diazotrophicus TaxID=1400979 RepID=A0A3D8LB94_9BACT|nr:hypothetical protein [Pontibacter diazotrophicus]RDV14670.1 hypothetical protein DXT99_13465 [Pontibacter diazotrophicus]
MNNLYLLLFLLITGCAPKQQQEVVQVAETEEVGSTVASEGGCDKCAASKFVESEPDTSFIFSNGSKLLICGYPELREGRKIYSEFVLSECGKDSIIDFWSAVEEYEIRYKQDTLQLQKLELLALGNNREFVKKKWLTEYFYYENGKLEREKKLNSEVKYSQSQVEQSLQEYESTQWQKQSGATEEYTENKMRLANSLMIAAASGSEKADVYFKEFKSKFQPDGAYLEWYEQMVGLLESAKK